MSSRVRNMIFVYDGAPYETNKPRRFLSTHRRRVRSTAPCTHGQKCARRASTTPHHAMSSGALEPKTAGDFYWSKDEVRRASPPRFADFGVCL